MDCAVCKAPGMCICPVGEPPVDHGPDKNAIIVVMAEVRRATRKFPTWPTDPIHAFAVLAKEFGELAKAVLQETYEPHKNETGEVRKEAIQTAAMAIRFIMSIEHYETRKSNEHQQATP
ncbi:MAG: hypothetical protein ABL936_19115 [Aestuariivirga sp.]